VSVTEQMVIHAQEFNIRIDQIERLALVNHKELIDLVYELVDKVSVLEIRMKELHSNEMA
tara:strand:- start:2175 stop:2354 length:180 start_codon:yes stop_codon:yes gene_type:complete